MASPKAMEYEKKLLECVSQLKLLVNENFHSDTDVKIKFLITINDTFEVAHSEARRLRKACAYLHGNVERLTNQVIKLGGVPDTSNG